MPRSFFPGSKYFRAGNYLSCPSFEAAEFNKFITICDNVMTGPVAIHFSLLHINVATAICPGLE